MALAFEARSGLTFSFFFFLLLCSATARNPIIFSSDEALNMVGRSLKVINLDDYGGPTANRGHDPTLNRPATGRGRRVGRKG
ncbi:hypothetical protein MtrunA17_Chr3g0105201 [Medicago truncatula]|uniref:Transmembrane protein, putative n=1 Tax=Medicago truncatula TaxID=3880 RepID=A0A072UYX5_MEDTR|nr:protein PSY1 [Medicago truncatula]KEH34303.1 transmembrane protein, putative [Medicago truncatula]RHN67673.1 hypothetical protein MtrunA17_Chr3g0105201 [Medicago truncatula]